MDTLLLPFDFNADDFLNTEYRKCSTPPRIFNNSCEDVEVSYESLDSSERYSRDSFEFDEVSDFNVSLPKMML